MVDPTDPEEGTEIPSEVGPESRSFGAAAGFRDIQEAVAVSDKILASEDEVAKKRLRDALQRTLEGGSPTSAAEKQGGLAAAPSGTTTTVKGAATTTITITITTTHNQ